ncbi:MAG: sulfite exporter TauE/SafE family protein [Okeania sp. SIO3I5]|uniref:sulfite exporter TauE/SafE family protein n=1 Tax=Okeania sp. SIO3I5 TaxID=2607805 RepID=UPI0013BE8540|nr:sulfite exporter TauE/SafE family protein [Okeania sp. SIO3I5]NEQ35060.1 sulfite exporter TauE/SafE family protein [Okeania sp. SIO3I5]
MIPTNLLILAVGGLCAGILAGFLGIGGGTIMVPLLLALGYQPIQAVATSALAITITASSGTLQNWRMGYIKPKRVLLLALPALFTAQVGVYLAQKFSSTLLLLGFGSLMLVNIYLVELRKRVIAKHKDAENNGEKRQGANPTIARIITGGTAGLLAGLFGVGGGVIMIPLQILLLGEPIKAAIRTSLGVIVVTSISAAFGHYLNGNVLFVEGLCLGFAGLISAQISTRFLPKLPSSVVSFAFRTLLVILAIYTFWKAWQV